MSTSTTTPPPRPPERRPHGFGGSREQARDHLTRGRRAPEARPEPSADQLSAFDELGR